jgi:hypothetical protein
MDPGSGSDRLAPANLGLRGGLTMIGRGVAAGVIAVAGLAAGMFFVCGRRNRAA